MNKKTGRQISEEVLLLDFIKWLRDKKNMVIVLSQDTRFGVDGQVMSTHPLLEEFIEQERKFLYEEATP